ncbi:hydrolase [Gammaproteobacteria bacterium ESL0073]|nr:hydrolase [Gammaproteobacteria bacterium ESL0073]
MKFVDSHAHVFTNNLNFIPTARYTPNYDATPDNYISNLTTYGFQYGLLIQPSFLGFDNSYMIAAIAQFPDRLKGVSVVPMDTSLEQLKMMKKQGIIGARLNLFGVPLPDLTTPEAKHFLHNLQAVNWHLELHCPPNFLVKLLPQLQLFDIQVVIDHFGRIDPKKGFDDPDYQTVLSLLNTKQHWVKVSGYYRLGKRPESIKLAQKAYQALKERGLLSRLIWGSDWPNTQHEADETYQGNLDAFRTIVTDPKEQQAILGDNAIKFLTL